MRRLALAAALLLAALPASAQVYQIGDSIPFAAAFPDADGVLQTGLTVTVDCLRGTTEVVTGASATEDGGSDGTYHYTLAGANVTTASKYTCRFNDGSKDAWLAYDVAPAHANLDAAVSSRSDFDETTDPVELLDSGGSAGTSAAEVVTDIWAATSRTLTSTGTVTVVGPVATSGSASIIRGDSYQAAQSRALEWSGTDWPDITGADTLVLTVGAGGRRYTYTGSAVDADTVRVELTSAQTITLPVGAFDFDIEADFSGEKVTLVRAAEGFTVLSDVSQ